MTLADFQTIIKKVPRHVRIDFSGMSEPWVNPACTDMLAWILEFSTHPVAIYTTLIGMSPKDEDRVIGLLSSFHERIEVLCLHLPDANGNMRGYRQHDNYTARLKKFLRFGDTGVLNKFEVMTMDHEGHVHHSLSDLLRLGPWHALTRAGNVDSRGIGNQPVETTPQHDKPVACSFTPFYDQNVVLPNGDVVLCCMDYSSKHKIGNLLHQSYYEMFGAPELARLRLENQNFGYNAVTASLCRSCSRAVTYDLDLAKPQYWQATSETMFDFSRHHPDEWFEAHKASD
jgi:hypothetical protein